MPVEISEEWPRIEIEIVKKCLLLSLTQKNVHLLKLLHYVYERTEKYIEAYIGESLLTSLFTFFPNINLQLA